MTPQQAAIVCDESPPENNILYLEAIRNLQNSTLAQKNPVRNRAIAAREMAVIKAVFGSRGILTFRCLKEMTATDRELPTIRERICEA
ncbi:MAG: hypothetical protein Q4A06_05655 [Cardiobacteriaceae bacterium]|nr:hypothetical protein [Cardiobacteriaceae bacterium]